MNDPAIEAAQRAVAAVPNAADYTYGELVDTAREALKPIRDRHRPYDRPISYGSPETERVCNYCLGPIKWPCPDARDAYSNEELER